MTSRTTAKQPGTEPTASTVSTAAATTTGSGAKLAFGNANTGTGLENEKWGNNTLNQYNRSGGGYLGCTFGLVTRLDSNGHIIYADGVDAPNLFDDGNATGKSTYTDWSLGFNRVGDTYTLSSVNGAGLDGLEYFNNPQTPGQDPYTHIWTNNFWPLDGRRSTDGLTGYYNDRGGYSGYDGNKLYPAIRISIDKPTTTCSACSIRSSLS